METRTRTGESLARRAVSGSIYGITASGVTLVLGFTRAVLLARLLLPEHFGVVTLAVFYVGLAAQLRALGLDQALIHRQDVDRGILSTYFLLRMSLDILVLGLLFALAPLLQGSYPAVPGLGQVLRVLIPISLFANLSQVQETLLHKELAFRKLAATDVAASLTMTLVAPYLAWRGWGVWALVAEQASGILMRALLIWGPFRHWKPGFTWNGLAARWFWNYGKPLWLASNLEYVLDHFDDFWVGTALGSTPLGYYAKAYEFALYPRRVFANPLVSVFTPIFARLQSDRLRLSQAFFRSAHLTLRTGLLIAGAFSLILPEFIKGVIGSKWLPMLWTFRLMLVYTALDSLLLLVRGLLLAVGQPRALRTSTIVQVLFFIPAVVVGAALWGINGVALAADGMLVVGAGARYRPLKRCVDFSLFRLAFWPFVALGVALGGGLALEASWHPASLWWQIAGKVVLFGGLYLGLLTLVEGRDYQRSWRWLWANLYPRGTT